MCPCDDHGTDHQQRPIDAMKHTRCHTAVKDPRESGAAVACDGDQVRALFLIIADLIYGSIMPADPLRI